jgi:paraquat-inducible protein B
MADALGYLRNAIRRIETGEVMAGSHVAGIFSRSATDFESAIRSYVDRLLKACNLQYETDLRPFLKGVAFEKTTLGNLIAGIERAATLRSNCVQSHIPSGQELRTFLEQLRAVNQAWVRMKHRGEVARDVILAKMGLMSEVLAKLTSERGAGCDRSGR